MFLDIWTVSRNSRTSSSVFVTVYIIVSSWDYSLEGLGGYDVRNLLHNLFNVDPGMSESLQLLYK